MSDAVTAITTAVTPAALFGALTAVAPIVIVGLTVGFSLTVLRRVVGGLGKGKAKI